ncbi:MAG: hypothetical protein NTW21_13815 [Verrucomicrobia bacterium]|nr:hypothetical protein [Verrucomicrobiota bacterium]
MSLCGSNEQRVSTLGAAAIGKACRQALAAGQKVPGEWGGGTCGIAPDGTRKFTVPDPGGK